MPGTALKCWGCWVARGSAGDVRLARAPGPGTVAADAPVRQPQRGAVLVHGVLHQFPGDFLTVLVPLRFQSVTGAGADSAALHLLPLAMGLPIGAYFAGRRTSVTGRYKPMILSGALLFPFAILGMAFTAPDAFWLSSLFMLLSGIASGMQFPTSLVGSQNAVQQQDIGVATSTTNLFRSSAARWAWP